MLSLNIINYNSHLVKTLSHIARYCTRLNHLVILGLRAQSQDVFVDQEEEGSIKSGSLKSLTLKRCILSQEQLLFVVNQLLCLENLVFKDYINPGQAFYSMHLPTLSLECLEIDMETEISEISVEGYYIKLITEVNPTPRRCFLMMKHNDVKDRIAYHLAPNSSESAYNNSTVDKKIAVYDIYLKFVEKLTIKYVDAKNGYHKTIDMYHTL